MAAPSAVTDAFKLFDQDGNGTISRQELGEVLKMLEPDSWNKRSLDHLMLTADRSGDGQLNLDEFMKWMFAEDGAPQEYKAGFVLQISGCSRELFNGEYLQQGFCSGGRPVFFCAANKLFLYYQQELGRWHIFWKVGSHKAGAYLKTIRAPHMAYENQSWEVWNGRQKTFRQEEEMKCVMPQDRSHEELVSQAAPSLLMTSPDILCEFQKTSEIHNRRPVYASGDCQLKYDAATGIWEAQVGSDVAKSLRTEAYSPYLCCWDDGVEVEVLTSASEEKGEMTDSGVFVDPEFPHSIESIGEAYYEKRKLANKEVVWKRLSDKAYWPLRPCKLFDDEAPFDLKQGALGNCGLMSRIAALGEFNVYLKQHIFKTTELTTDGKYEIQLFNPDTKEWQIIVLDEFVPCYKMNPVFYEKFFAKSSHSIWAALLEKAFAKVLGSYEKTAANDPKGISGSTAMVMLTGGEKFHCLLQEKNQSRWMVACEVEARKDPEGEVLGKLPKFHPALGKIFLYELETAGDWMKYEMMPHCKAKMDEKLHTGWVPMSLDGERSLEAYALHGWKHSCCILGDNLGKNQQWLEKDAAQTDKELFELLRECDESNYLMTATLWKSSMRNGLSPQHSYSLLRVVDTGSFKMVSLRNPHGRNEWKGPWSDHSEEWEQHPEVAAALSCNPENFDKDGMFWMDLTDFLMVFDSVEIMAKALPGKRGEFRLDLGDD